MYFYENKYPEIGNIVMTRITKVDDNGVECELLEYNNSEAFLSVNELSKRRVRSAKQEIKPNTILPLEVIYVDLTRGYVDVSKKRITIDESDKHTQHYQTMKQGYSIIKRTAELLTGDVYDPDTEKDEWVEYFQQNLVWPYYREHTNLFAHFENVIREGDELFNSDKLSPEAFSMLMEQLQKRIKIVNLTLTETVSVSDFGPDGIDGVKRCLLAGSIDGVDITVNNCPNYDVSIVCTNRNIGKEILKTSLEMMEHESKLSDTIQFEVVTRIQN